MSVVFQRMAGSLQQSLSMMESMNTCMEEYVRNSIRMNVAVKFPRSSNSNCEHRLRLYVSISNIGKLPISAIKLSIMLKTMNGGIELPQLLVDHEPEVLNKRPKLAHPSRSGTSSPLAWRQFLSDSDNPAGTCCEVGPLDLAPMKDMVWDIELRLPQAAQYDGCLAARFPSPGTGAILEAQARFDVFLLHQCRRRSDFGEGVAPMQGGANTDAGPARAGGDGGVKGSGRQTAARVSGLRRLLAIPARNAVAEGRLAGLDGPDGLPVRGGGCKERAERPPPPNHTRALLKSSARAGNLRPAPSLAPERAAGRAGPPQVASIYVLPEEHAEAEAEAAGEEGGPVRGEIAPPRLQGPAGTAVSS